MLASFIRVKTASLPSERWVRHAPGIDSGAKHQMYSRMSYVTKVSASGVSGLLGQYAYAGSSRRVSATIGAALLALDFFTGSAAGYPGLDRFGRVIDQHYVRASGAGAGQTVHRYQYGYDLSGNRTFARVTQVPVDSVPQDNTRSYAYGYDELQRLTRADLGALDSGSVGVPPAVPNPTRTVDWTLDNLGNWSGAPDQLPRFGGAPKMFPRSGLFNGQVTGCDRIAAELYTLAPRVRTQRQTAP